MKSKTQKKTWKNEKNLENKKMTLLKIKNNV